MMWQVNLFVAVLCTMFAIFDFRRGYQFGLFLNTVFAGINWFFVYKALTF